MNKTILVLLTFLSLKSFSQEREVESNVKCGSYQANLEIEQQYPDIHEERNQLNIWTKQYETSSNKTRSGYVIPVVFHINDPSNPQKVTLAQVQSAINILNEDFNAQNPDINTVRAPFSGIVADVGVSFCLATKDPQGNPTTGITYHTNNLNGREPDGTGSAVKSISAWPCEKYLNIWIVNRTENDNSLYNSGWAYYPSTSLADQSLDGIIYNHRYLGYGQGSSDVSGPGSWQANMARVLTHEVGHYLNVKHTFENYCNAPGDDVADTPPVYHHGSNNCNSNWTLCSGVTTVNEENYMDYSDCPKMFTNGQKARMLAALNSNVGYRNNLWSQTNLVETGCLTFPTSVTGVQKKPKKLLYVIDILGREVIDVKNAKGVVIFVYDDGSAEKKMHLE